MGLARFLTLVAVILTGIINVEAGFCLWAGPTIVVETGWGEGEQQVGFNRGDNEDGFPRKFCIFPDGKIVVEDIWNSKLKVFNQQGAYIKAIKLPGEGLAPFATNLIVCSKYYDNWKAKGVGLFNFNDEIWRWNDLNENIGIRGDVKLDLSSVYIDESKNIYIWSNRGIGYKYSETGSLLETYTNVPKVFGVRIDWGRNVDGQYYIKAKFGDEVFAWKGTMPFSSYHKISSNLIYAYGNAGNKTDKHPHKRIHKISKCGKVVATLDLPQDPDAIEYDQKPVFAENGDVYIWKRTPDTYSILKWTWVDDPTDPKPGPDTPDNFQVIPATQGIYVTWDLSPQDPGCVDTYQIERATSVDGIYTTLTTVPKGQQSFNDASAVQGQDYYYRLRAVADDLYSDFTTAMSGKWTGQ